MKHRVIIGIFTDMRGERMADAVTYFAVATAEGEVQLVKADAWEARGESPQLRLVEEGIERWRGQKAL